MQLTPELFLEASFGSARRGYDMEEVDDFLERAADAVAEMRTRLEHEFERAEVAEDAVRALQARVAELEAALDTARQAGTATAAAPVPADREDLLPEDVTEAAPAAPVEAVAAPEPIPAVEEMPAAPVPPVSVDEPMRILVHAQRTADAAVAEARAQAAELTAEAEALAAAARAEADSLLERARTDAESEARRAGESARRTVQNELLALRHDRDVLAEDVRALRRWLDEQRSRLRTTAREMQRLVDDPSALRELPVPETSTVELGASAGPGEVAPTEQPRAEGAAAPGGEAAPEFAAGVAAAADAPSTPAGEAAPQPGQGVPATGEPATGDGEPTAAVPMVDLFDRAAVEGEGPGANAR